MRFQRLEPLRLVAASLLVVMVASVYSGPGRSAIHRPRQFSVVAPVGDLDQLPAEFEWQVVPGAVTYAVRVFEEDRIEVWSVESRGWRIAIPPAMRERVTAGRAFRWQVVALNPSGEEIASTGLQVFRIYRSAADFCARSPMIGSE